ncbi:LysE family translocator [Fictibacillus fluitans]|uniref:LysE family translocator n=1 Tax=Fictibacillus fluitans TaxID=3058422 RepID=A0ABT8HYS6_9BACL|nr:LysE family translocator [Fictibacillus sp. NE201]MDN4525928.1 LysE family translocator [Fictibacillus sp. NE201]
MEAVSILSFLAAAIVLTIMPGPDNLFVLAQSIAKGKKAGISTSLGLCTGLIVHITAVTVGLSAVIYQSAIIFSIIKYAGAAYLLFLAYKSFREKDSQINLASGDTLNYSALYKRGIIMNVLNPKVSLFFLAFLPQFVNYKSGHVSLQMLTYGILFLLQALLLFTLFSIFAEKAGSFLRKNPRVSGKINFIQGSLFTLIGLKIAFSQR